jgi:hypothetical protein
VRDPDLAEHLRRKVQHCESLMIAFDAQLRPVAHRVRSLTTPLHFALQRG